MASLTYFCIEQLIDVLVTQDLQSSEKDVILQQLWTFLDSESQQFDLNEAFESVQDYLNEERSIHRVEELAKKLLETFEPSDVAAILTFLQSVGERHVGRSSRRSLTSASNSGVRRGLSANDISEYANPKRQRSNLVSNVFENQPVVGIVEQIYKDCNPDLIKEDDMIRYIFYTLLGSTSELFPIDKSTNTISIPNGVDDEHSALLKIIFEASLLYSYLQTVTKKNYNSQVKVAFVSQVKFYLQQYTQVINELSVDNQTSIKTTLIGIYSKVVFEIDKFRFLYFIADRLEETPGDEILSLVYFYSHFGDNLIRSVATKLFEICSVPYFKIFQDWVMNGELMDRNKEFFVYKAAEDESEFQSVVGLKYDQSKYPSFLPDKLGDKIYQIGKIILFLRDICKEYQFLNEFNQKYYNFPSTNGDSLNNNQLPMFINSQYLELTGFLTNLLHKDYKIDLQILNLKRFMLLSQGDFIQSIFEYGSSILDEPYQTLSTVQLANIMTKAIENSSVNSYERDTLRRLDARLLDMNYSTSVGWELFTLDYKLDPPLRLVLYNGLAGLRSYLRLFNFLWRMKRSSFILDSAWNNFNYLYRCHLRKLKGSAKNAWIVKSCLKLHLAKNKMISFVTTIFSYLNFDIIETAFDELVGKLNESDKLFSNNGLDRANPNGNSSFEKYLKKFNRILMPKKVYVQQANATVFNDGIPEATPCVTDAEVYSIDEFISLHKDFLSKVSGNKLLDSTKAESRGITTGKVYIHQITDLLSIIGRYVKAEKDFLDVVLDYISKLQLEDDEDEDMADSFTGDELEKMERIFETVDTKIINEFEKKRLLFVDDLRADIDLSSLALRLGL